jgi:hypothetical protein
VALDPFGLQHPVDPEAVQTGLLDDDNRRVLPIGLGVAELLKLPLFGHLRN